MAKTFKIPFAFDKAGNLFDYKTAVKGVDYFCQCGDVVRIRGGEVMSDHFYHINETECSNESAIHDSLWRFNVLGISCDYLDVEIESHPERFEVVRKNRKIKSVRMKEVNLIKVKDNECYCNIRSASYSTEYILAHPDEFIIEYED